MKAVAVIPARGGSKGIPGKNLRDVAGKPLIQHSIEHALHADRVSGVYVTTDDEEIAWASRDAGARVIIRPKEFASDTASSESALLHAIESIRETSGEYPDTIVFLQCTSPIRHRDDIDNALVHFEAEGADSLLSVVESHRFLWREENGGVAAVNYDPSKRPRRQDMSPSLMENGSLYIFDARGFLETGTRLFGKIVVYKMAAESACEIDDEMDIVIVNALMEFRRGKGQRA